MTIKSALDDAARQLVNSTSARLDAEVLLTHVLQKDRSWLFTWPDKPVPSEQWRKFNGLVNRRQQGEPVAYIVGEQEFWSLPLTVNNSTLIPRPETELLVELALQQMPEGAINVLDLGTGSGAIALALAWERPAWKVTAVDNAGEAVSLAQHNADKLGLSRVCCLQSDWFARLSDQRFELIVSNPPYIDDGDEHLNRGDVRFEPKSALVADQGGVAAFAAIADEAPLYLMDSGCLIFEHGYTQGKAVREMLLARGYQQVQTFADLAGHERVTLGIYSGAGE